MSMWRIYWSGLFFLISIGSVAADELGISSYGGSPFNGNFHARWVDLAVPGEGVSPELTRTYNSLWSGASILGPGWCTNFDDRLHFSEDGNTLTYRQCGAGRRLILTREPGQETFAGRLGGFARGRLLAQGGAELQLDWGIRTFDADGRLVSYSNLSGSSAILAWDGSLLNSVKYSNGWLLRFDVVKSGGSVVVSAVKDGTAYPFSMIYDFSASGQLVSSRLLQKRPGAPAVELNQFTFTYCPDGLLCNMKWGEDSLDLFYAGNGSRRLSRLQSGNGECGRSYEYDAVSATTFNGSYSVRETTAGCDARNLTSETIHHRYHFRRNEAGLPWSLEKAEHLGESKSTEVIYDVRFGQPIKVTKTIGEEQNVTTDRSFDAQGRVNRLFEDTMATEFFYENENCANKATRIRQKDSASQHELTVTFALDARCNAVEIRNKGMTADGSEIDGSFRVGYSDRGVLSSFLHEKKKFLLDYDKRFGKPIRIQYWEGGKKGSMRISYRPDGAIDKIDSKDPVIITVRISQALNQLMELMGSTDTGGCACLAQNDYEVAGGTANDSFLMEH